MSKHALNDVKDVDALMELYPQDVFPETREGFRKWHNWALRQKAITAQDTIRLDVWFRQGLIKFRGHSYDDLH